MTKNEMIKSIKNTLTIEAKEINKLIEYADYDQIVLSNGKVETTEERAKESSSFIF